MADELDKGPVLLKEKLKVNEYSKEMNVGVEQWAGKTEGEKRRKDKYILTHKNPKEFLAKRSSTLLMFIKFRILRVIESNGKIPTLNSHLAVASNAGLRMNPETSNFMKLP